ncbi:protein transport protein S31, partial [Linderina pennispora]
TPAKPATPKPTAKYPAGDRSHLPAEWKPVVAALDPHIARAKQFAAPAQKRMVDDAERRLNQLFDLMNCDEVNKKEQLAPVFQALVRELDARRFPAALHHQAELMTINSELTTNLVGIKHLINVLKTLPIILFEQDIPFPHYTDYTFGNLNNGYNPERLYIFFDDEYIVAHVECS